MIIKSKGFHNVAIKSATYNMQNSSGAVAYTGVGFKPKMLIGMAVVAVANGCRAEGLAIDGSKAVNYNTPSTGLLDNSTSFFLIGVDAADPGALQRCVVNSFDDDGFTLGWTKVGTPGAATLEFSILCIG